MTTPWNGSLRLCWLLSLGVTFVAPARGEDLELLGVRALEGGGPGTGSPAEDDPDSIRRKILPIRALPESEFDSDRSNPCGPYAVTTVLRHACRADANFHVLARRMTPDETVGSTLTTLMRELLRGGMRVSSKSQASPADLMRAIDGGNPVIALTHGRVGPHWVIVKGYEARGDEVTAVYLEDTLFAWGARHDGMGDLPDGQRMSIHRFQRLWEKPLWPGIAGGIVSFVSGYGNTMIVAHMDGGGSSDIPLLSVNPASALSTGALDVWIGVRDRDIGRTLGGIGQVLSGLTTLPAHAVGAGLDFAGRQLQNGGRWLEEHLGPAGAVLGLPARVAGGGLSLVGRGVKNVTNGALGVASRIFG